MFVLILQNSPQPSCESYDYNIYISQLRRIFYKRVLHRIGSNGFWCERVEVLVLNVFGADACHIYTTAHDSRMHRKRCQEERGLDLGVRGLHEFQGTSRFH